MRLLSISSDSRSSSHSLKRSDDGLPSYVKEKKGSTPTGPSRSSMSIISPSQSSVPSTSVTFASAQSAWSQEMPSPPSDTFRKKSLFSDRSTLTGTPGSPPRITEDWNFSCPATFTEKTTLPRPPEVLELLSTPAIAVKVFPGLGRRTCILLTAWQYSPRVNSCSPILRGLPARALSWTGSLLARTTSPDGWSTSTETPSNFAFVH